jgi:tetratricopeptide (TPR) repeat protein
MYSPRDVAAIVGLAESRVRYWAQTGFVGPSERQGGHAVYTFRDLVGVKAAKELLERGLSMQRVRKTLDALRAQLPELDRPIEHLRVVSDGERLVVMQDGAAFEPLSGQLVMDFDVSALSGRVAEVMELAPPSATAPSPSPSELPSATAYQRFLDAVEADAGAPDAEQLVAWRAVLAADASFAAAHTNLGAVLHRLGRLDEARAAFERALALDPEQPEARYNLGNLLADAGDDEGAIAAWTRVAADCPEFADAHFNLGLALARDGAGARARSHLEHYLALEGDSDGKWAQRARALLAGLTK